MAFQSLKTVQAPLVFVHGFLGNPSDWDGLISYLPKGPFIPIELPGHGSTPFTEHFTIIPPAPKFHLAGYSMGGRLSLQYARKFPDRILSLTILSAHRGLKTWEEKDARLKKDEQWAKKLLTLSIDEFLTQWYDQPLFHSFKPDFSMRRNHNPEELAKTLLYYSLAYQPLYQPEQALYLVGEKDSKYRALYPKAIVVPKSGHMIHIENPKYIADIIKEKIL